MSTKRTTPNVGFIRPEYNSLKPRWDKIRDCIAGEDQIKSRGDVYLPRPNPTDLSAENLARYEQYKQRAVFYNATNRTLQGMVGEVCAKDPEVDLPATIELLKDNVDGGGVALDQQSRSALEMVISYGRCGLMVDYPTVDKDVTLKEQQKGEIRPNIILIQPWDIINWRVTQYGGVLKLSLVVLKEQYVTDDDGFEQELDDQWKVLSLDEQGLYEITEWVKTKESTKDQPEYIIKGSDTNEAAIYQPTDASGKRLDYIPFIFPGSNNNEPTPDLPPLYDLAALNIAHYRNSADYEESCFVTGQPTPYFAGLTEDWVKDVMKGQVQLGARAAVPLPEGGTAGLLQPEANSMPFEAMQHKEKQMVTLGARLVEQRDVQRTAQEAGQDKAGELSILGTIAVNVSMAYEQCLKWALAFQAKVTDKVELTYELNTDFEAATLSGADLTAHVAAWQSRAITFEEMRSNLIRGGVAYLPVEDALKKLDEEPQDLTGPIAAPGAAGKGTPPAKKPAAEKKE